MAHSRNVQAALVFSGYTSVKAGGAQDMNQNSCLKIKDY